MNDKIVKKNWYQARYTGKYIYANINLETDKNTVHKIIEVNGIKYCKIIYNLWIKDND